MTERIFKLTTIEPELQRLEIAIQLFSETEDKHEAKRLLGILRDRFVTKRAVEKSFPEMKTA